MEWVDGWMGGWVGGWGGVEVGEGEWRGGGDALRVCLSIRASCVQRIKMGLCQCASLLRLD